MGTIDNTAHLPVLYFEIQIVPNCHSQKHVHEIMFNYMHNFVKFLNVQ